MASINAPELRLIIGISECPQADLWRELAAYPQGVELSSAAKQNFAEAAALDVEIMATSLIVARLGRPVPIGKALIYNSSRRRGEPVVIAPPVLSSGYWPQELHSIPREARKDYKLLRSKYGIAVALYMWRRVFQAVNRVQLNNNYSLRVGFHCSTISYWADEHHDDVRAFDAAFKEARARSQSELLILSYSG